MALPTVPNNPAGHASVARRWLAVALFGWVLTMLASTPAPAIPIVNDTRDFEGVPWGAAFGESETFQKVEDTGRLKAYEVKGEPPALGSATVDSMRFYTANGKFARVVVRYHGKESHDHVIKYLEARYGELDRTPGQIASGLVKFHNWHGPETDVTLRYEARTDQGIIFFESQVWAPQLSEGNAAAGF